LEKEIENLKNQNTKFLNEKKNHDIQLNLLKSQIENMDKLNKEYEEMIDNLKIQLEKEKQNTISIKEEKNSLMSENNMCSTDDEK